MDRIGLEILHQELIADARVLQDSALAARARVAQTFTGSTEACGYQLNRFYNILERGFERICESFENHFEKRGDYHENGSLKGFGIFSVTPTTCPLIWNVSNRS